MSYTCGAGLRSPQWLRGEAALVRGPAALSLRFAVAVRAGCGARALLLISVLCWAAAGSCDLLRNH